MTQAIREALEAIRIYAADTLSGRTDGPDDRDWQREAVREIHRRALAALRSPARADRAVTADSCTKPPYPVGEADKKLAADWYTWGFQAGLEAEKRGAVRDAAAAADDGAGS